MLMSFQSASATECVSVNLRILSENRMQNVNKLVVSLFQHRRHTFGCRAVRILPCREVRFPCGPRQDPRSYDPRHTRLGNLRAAAIVKETGSEYVRRILKMPDRIFRDQCERHVVKMARDGDDRIRIQKSSMTGSAARKQVTGKIRDRAGDHRLMSQEHGILKERCQSPLLQLKVGIHPQAEIKTSRRSPFPKFLVAGHTFIIQECGE